jgi:hypothetical protein
MPHPDISGTRRFPSKPDRDPHSPDVYEILHGFDKRIGGLEDASVENKLANASIINKLEDIKATDRHAFTKLIAALVTTAITVIGGQRLLAPAAVPADTAHVPARTTLDVKLDVCRPMAPGPSREECFARVTSETEH